jgi:hypothetical protein
MSAQVDYARTSASALLIANRSLLAVTLLKQISDNFSEMTIVSDDYGWDEVSKARRLQIESAENINVEYILSVISGEDISKNNYENNLKLTERLTKANHAKTIIAIDKNLNNSKTHLEQMVQRMAEDASVFAGVIYFGDVLEDEIGDVKLKLLTTSYPDITLITDSQYYLPLPAAVISENIISKLFSLSAYGRRHLLVSKPITTARLKEVLSKLDPSVEFNYKDSASSGEEIKVDEKIFVDLNYEKTLEKLLSFKNKTSSRQLDIEKAVKETATTSASKTAPTEREKRHNKLTIVKLKLQKGVFGKARHFRIKMATVLISLLALGILPVVTLVLSTSLFFVSKYLYNKNEIFYAAKFISVSEKVSLFTHSYSYILSRPKYIGVLYKPVTETAGLSTDFYSIGRRGLVLFLNTEKLIDNSLNNRFFDMYDKTSQLDLEAQYLAERLDFLIGEMDSSSMITQRTFKRIISKDQLNLVNKRLKSYRTFMHEFPYLSGGETPKTYLVLIEDGNYLRPSGGNIEAFGLLKFSNGGLESTEFHKVDYADANLTGIVEPPLPLKNYFGVANWDLKHANWDVDFPTSSQQAEWFLDKELNIPIEGVMAVDSRFIEDQLQPFETQTGDLDSKADDYYQRLGEKFIGNLKNLKEKQRIAFVKSAVDEFDSKAILLYINQNDVQRELSNISWDGNVVIGDSCGNNCLEDNLGVFEAVTKGSSSQVNKEMDFEVNFEEAVVKRKLTFFLENHDSNKSYSGYLQVVTGSDAGFGNVEIVGKDGTNILKPEVVGLRGMKLAGVSVSVEPGETRALIFSWESGENLKLDENGKYIAKIIKQPWADNYPVELRVNFPKNTTVKEFKPFSLTENGVYSYNYQLSRDKTLTITW